MVKGIIKYEKTGTLIQLYNLKSISSEQHGKRNNQKRKIVVDFNIISLIYSCTVDVYIFMYNNFIRRIMYKVCFYYFTIMGSFFRNTF